MHYFQLMQKGGEEQPEESVAKHKQHTVTGRRLQFVIGSRRAVLYSPPRYMTLCILGTLVVRSPHPTGR